MIDGRPVPADSDRVRPAVVATGHTRAANAPAATNLAVHGRMVPVGPGSVRQDRDPARPARARPTVDLTSWRGDDAGWSDAGRDDRSRDNPGTIASDRAVRATIPVVDRRMAARHSVDPARRPAATVPAVPPRPDRVRGVRVVAAPDLVRTIGSSTGRGITRVRVPSRVTRGTTTAGPDRTRTIAGRRRAATTVARGPATTTEADEVPPAIDDRSRPGGAAMALGRTAPYRPAGRGGPPYAGAALPRPEALGPDEELVAGRRPVEEAFVARRPAIRLLVVPQRRAALEKVVLHATSLRIPIVEVEGGSLTALAGFDGHQGVALVVEPRRFAGIDDVLARAAERGEPPFVLVLDSMEDPHNVGSLLRSAEAAGVHGVLFPTHRQAPLSPSAIKASAGAVEHLLLCPVDDLSGALSDLHAHGLRIAGADGDAPMTARDSDLRGPIAIVVGSEGQGLGPAVRRRCDLFMRIPMRGAVGSLNAAVAGSILLFEAVAQRDTGERAAEVGGEAAFVSFVAEESPRPPEPASTATAVGKRAKAGKTAQAAKTPRAAAVPKAAKAPKPANASKAPRPIGEAKAAKALKAAKAPPPTAAKAAKAPNPVKAPKPTAVPKAAKASPKATKPATSTAKPATNSTPPTKARLATATKPPTKAKPATATKPAARAKPGPKAAVAPKAKAASSDPATDELLPADAKPRASRRTRKPAATD